MYYNPYMEYLFPDRGAFYKLQRFADPDVDALIELCTKQWQNGWVLGDIVCGDESIVAFGMEVEAMETTNQAMYERNSGICGEN